MLSQKIRTEFLEYFKKQGHMAVPSSPVVPLEDPTILFTNAGMNQFKDVFLGQSKRDYTRATSSQKCIRVGGKHNDLENVGHTSRHLTFFEMLGNFSFGDYFKEEAIKFAWEAATQIFDFNPDKIWASVFQEDEEAFHLWEKHLPPSRIIKMGEKDNFWAMGETGPCGPCSELLYDRGPEYGNALSPLQDSTGERYLEFWNLVFMQHNRLQDGSLIPLPKKSVDTGAGLERIVSLKMNVDNVFLTDVLFSLVQMLEKISNQKFSETSKLSPAFYVIADHIRTLAFAIADGAMPSNVDRGYILRKLIRRAVKYGRRLGLTNPFLAKLLPNLTATMGEDYPELKTQQSKIAEVLTMEEENFIRTLQRGGCLLNDMIENNKTGKISGENVFKLKDTYGFPVEEILLMAKDAHLEVDLATFKKLEEKAKEKSRQAQKCSSQAFVKNVFAEFIKKNPPCEFTGYEKTSEKAKVIAIFTGEKFINALKPGEKGFLILDKTPFYAEGGGQIGDSGKITKENNLFEVTDTASPFPGVICHLGTVKTGIFKTNDQVAAEVNTEKRQLTAANHSATHLIHFALNKVLKGQIKQAGSYVSDQRLRFDFNYHKALSLSEIQDLEDLVNNLIRQDFYIKPYTLSYEKAQKDKDIKQFFGEKYGSSVRVIEMGPSKELCGGTHTQSTGRIGLFKIIKEHSIAAGIRRIEAATGPEAELLIREKEDLITRLGALFKTQEGKLESSITNLIEENKKLKEEKKAFRKKALTKLRADLLQKQKKKNSFSYIIAKTDLETSETASFAGDLLQEMGSGLVVLACQFQDKCLIQIVVSDDLAEKNLDALTLIKKIAPVIKGGGGGNKIAAKAGGKDPAKISQALNIIETQIQENQHY